MTVKVNPTHSVVEANYANDEESVDVITRACKPITIGYVPIHYGWLPSLAYVHNGLGERPGIAAFGNDTVNPDMWRRTFVHEVGHNFGLEHPLKDAPLTTAGDHWFDVYDRVIKPVPATVIGIGDNLLDFMVPKRLESEAWISPTNYNKLLDQLCSVPGAAAPAITSQPQASDFLIINGSVNSTTPVTGVIDPLLHLSTVATSLLTAGSQDCVDLKDNLGGLLDSSCFDFDFADDDETHDATAAFSMAVPYPDGLNQVDQVQTSSGKVLASRFVGAHAPSVSLAYPNAAGLTLSRAQTIAWNGSDPDHDPLPMPSSTAVITALPGWGMPRISPVAATPWIFPACRVPAAPTA